MGRVSNTYKIMHEYRIIFGVANIVMALVPSAGMLYFV